MWRTQYAKQKRRRYFKSQVEIVSPFNPLTGEKHDHKFFEVIEIQLSLYILDPVVRNAQTDDDDYYYYYYLFGIKHIQSTNIYSTKQKPGEYSWN